MGTSTYQVSRPDAALDLSCYNISCGADVCICDENGWRSEAIGADKKVAVKNGLCPTDLDPTAHQLPVHCVDDVDPKCGCLSCGGDSDGGLTADDVTTLIAEQVPAIAAQCATDAIVAAAAEKV